MSVRLKKKNQNITLLCFVNRYEDNVAFDDISVNDDSTVLAVKYPYYQTTTAHPLVMCKFFCLVREYCRHNIITSPA